MQDYEAGQDESSGLDEDNSNDQLATFIRSLIKRLVMFVCFGPGVLGVLWILGRLFKR